MGQTRGSKSMPWLQITASVPPFLFLGGFHCIYGMALSEVSVSIQ